MACMIIMISHSFQHMHSFGDESQHKNSDNTNNTPFWQRLGVLEPWIFDALILLLFDSLLGVMVSLQEQVP